MDDREETGRNATGGRPVSPARLRLALVLFLLNYALGWPALGAAGAASPWIGLENAALVGTGLYALSWLLLGLSIAIGGREVTAAGRAWIRRLRRRGAPTG